MSCFIGIQATVHKNTGP